MESFIKNYKIIKELGRGNYSVTYLAKINDVNVTLKAIPLYKYNVNYIYNEITTVECLSQPTSNKNILQYRNSFLDTFKGKCMIFIEYDYIDGITLDNFITSLTKLPPIHIVKCILIQLSQAIDYIHRNGYAHRDLKPANIIIESSTGYLKIIDFGFACSIECNDIVGSIYWLPPEVLFDDPVKGLNAAQAHDIWSLGIIFYQLTNLQLPYNIEGDAISNVKNGIIFESIYPNDEINDIIYKMLNINWFNRIRSDVVLNMAENIN